MAIDQLQVRMARLEGAFEQVNERLSGLERQISDLRRQGQGQFYWLMSVLLGSILIPIVRDSLR